MSKSTPAFKGLTWHRHQYYSFFVPVDWQRLNWPDDREGVLFVPSEDDPLTVLAVELRDLGLEATPEDLDDLNDGFRSGIQALPEALIEAEKTWHIGDTMCLDAKYTFADGDVRRKRWVRQFYHQTRQIAFTAQGASIEIYDYWQPMFFEAMMTTKIHNTLPETSSVL